MAFILLTCLTPDRYFTILLNLVLSYTDYFHCTFLFIVILIIFIFTFLLLSFLLLFISISIFFNI